MLRGPAWVERGQGGEGNRISLELNFLPEGRPIEFLVRDDGASLPTSAHRCDNGWTGQIDE